MNPSFGPPPKPTFSLSTERAPSSPIPPNRPIPIPRPLRAGVEAAACGRGEGRLGMTGEEGEGASGSVKGLEGEGDRADWERIWEEGEVGSKDTASGQVVRDATHCPAQREGRGLDVLGGKRVTLAWSWVRQVD